MRRKIHGKQLNNVRSKIKIELYNTNPFYKKLVDEENSKKNNHKNKPKKKKVKTGSKKYNLSYLFNKPYSEFLKSGYWIMVRNKILKRDNNSCVDCRETKNLHVHHKTYIHHFNEHEHLSDLITLCKSCHERIHSINN